MKLFFITTLLPKKPKLNRVGTFKFGSSYTIYNFSL